MRLSRTAAVATIVSTAAVSLFVAVSLALAWSESSDQRVGATLSAAVVVCFAVMGAVVAAARPSNRVGWIMLGGALLWSLGGAAVDLATHGIVTDPGSVPAASAFAVVGSSLRGAGWYVLVIGLPMVFPDGRLVAARWRWLPKTLAAAILCTVLGVLTGSDANLNGLGDWHNPIALPASAQFINAMLSFAGVGLGLIATVGVVAQLRVRWRHGDRLLRQQLILFGCAASLTVIAAPVALATGAGWIFSVSVLPLSFAVGVSVLAGGLYELKTAANRTLVWSTLSLVVAGIYVLIIAGMTSLLPEGSSTWLPWVGAAVIAVSFAPIRDVVQRTVNRLTYGDWDEPYAVLASLGQRLEATADTDRLLADAIAVLEGLGLSDVSIRDPEGTIIAGASTTSDVTALKLMAYGRPVGTLNFRAAEGGLRRRDHQLLADFAGQLGGVLQTRELVADLQRAVERLVLAREEERRRLRRDLHDGLGPALAGHTLRLDMIANELCAGRPVEEHVSSLRDELRSTVLEVRRVVEGLRPPALDELGLAGALTQAAQRLGAGSVTDIAVEIDALPAMSAAVEVAAYRVTTEALTNVIRHAQAASCRVRIAVVDDMLCIDVQDDGVWAASTDHSGNGLHTMRDRVEELRGLFAVVPGNGTLVRASFPLTMNGVHDVQVQR
jgi:signal transduction histidine kinase